MSTWAVAQVQLQTDDDMLAPWGQDTTSLFGVDVELDAGLLMRLGMIRVVSGVVVEWNPLWTGRVETWGDASAARGQIRTHVVTVTDVIGDLANVPTVITANDIPFSEWLDDNLLAASWLFGIDYYGGTGDFMLQDLNPVAAINRMDQGTDPWGLVWRSRRTGRLIVYPPPWDTTNVDRWANPLLDSYPSGLVFSFSPDFTDIEYIADDDAQPFGVQRTSLGVLNNFQVTTPSDLWLEDDPVSEARYGIRPFVSTWIGNGGEQVVIDLLNARAFSSAQALPLRTTLDHEGFWSAMAIVDHLDPVTVIHATTDDGLVVTAPGTIRNVTEDRTVRGIDDNDVRLLSWQSTVQIDITSTSAAPALLPVEDLTFLGGDSPLLGGPSSAQFSWTNPTQPDITPTEVQLRVLGRSLIWFPKSYPGVGADGVNIGFLNAATTYTLQVRLIRRVAGVITAFSATRQVTFTTPAIIIPIFVPDGDSTDVIVGGPDGEDCVLEVELQENDGTGWVTIESYTQSDLHQNDDGTWSLIYPVPNSTFVNDRIYRFRSREVCGGIDGQWFTGSSFDPPDDWTDPCTTPPALADPPWSDAELIVYVPKVCQGNDIVEAVSGITGVKGDAFDGFVQMLDQPDRIALLAIADPGWSTAPGPGILAYGECPQINGVVGSKTLGVFTAIADRSACVLVECANMQITSAPGSSSHWLAGATVTTPSGVMSLISPDIAVGVDGHQLLATFDSTTGTFTLYVDGIVVDSDTFGAPTNTSVALPIWRVGAPPESWVTDCAVWSRVVTPAGVVGGVHWWDFSNASSRTDGGGSSILAIADLIGSADMTANGAVERSTLIGAGSLTSGRATPSGGGAPQRMETTAIAITSQPYWASWIGKIPSTGSGTFFNLGFVGFASSTLWQIGSGGMGISVGTVDSNTHIFYAEYNGGSSKLYIDGSLAVSGNAGAGVVGGNGALFNTIGGGNGGDVAIGELLVGNGTNTGADITAEYDRLVAKWL